MKEFRIGNMRKDSKKKDAKTIQAIALVISLDT